MTVVGNPSWKSKPERVTVKAGENFKLSASFYGSETSLTVSWYLNNAKLNEKFEWKKVRNSQSKHCVQIFAKIQSKIFESLLPHSFN